VRGKPKKGEPSTALVLLLWFLSVGVGFAFGRFGPGSQAKVQQPTVIIRQASCPPCACAQERRAGLLP